MILLKVQRLIWVTSIFPTSVTQRAELERQVFVFNVGAGKFLNLPNANDVLGQEVRMQTRSQYLQRLKYGSLK